MNLEHQTEQSEAMRQEFGRLWANELLPTIKGLSAHAEPRTLWLIEHIAWMVFKKVRKG